MIPSLDYGFSYYFTFISPDWVPRCRAWREDFKFYLFDINLAARVWVLLSSKIIFSLESSSYLVRGSETKASVFLDVSGLLLNKGKLFFDISICLSVDLKDFIDFCYFGTSFLALLIRRMELSIKEASFGNRF